MASRDEVVRACVKKHMLFYFELDIILKTQNNIRSEPITNELIDSWKARKKKSKKFRDF